MAIMSDVIETVRNYLDEDGWKYEYEEDRHLIKAGVSLKSKLQSAKIAINFNENGYTVIAIPTIKADDASRMNVLEYITRANYGLRNGNFEMDLDDGEVRYKTYTNFKGLDMISKDVIEDSIVMPPVMFNRYGDGMAALMMGFSDPLTEIRKAEQ